MGTARKIRARRRADRNRAVAAAKPVAEKNDLGGVEETVAAFAPADGQPGAEKKVVGGLADFGTGEVRLRHADGSTSGDAMAPESPAVPDTETPSAPPEGVGFDEPPEEDGPPLDGLETE